MPWKGGSKIQDIIRTNKSKLTEYRDQFQQIFQIPLTKFMHPLVGFDVVAFDVWLKTPDGISTHDYIIEKYGQEACDLIKLLL